MMDLTNYNHNLTEEALLVNLPIFIESQERDIKIRIPTYRDTLEHYNFNIFLSILSVEYKKLAQYKKELPFAFKNRAELIRGLALWSAYKEIIQHYMEKYIEGIQFHKLKAEIDEVKLTSEEFELIADILLIGLAVRSYDFGDNGSDKEDNSEQETKNEKIRQMLQKEKEAKQKVLAAKQKEAKNSGNKVTMEKYIMSTIYTFGVSLQELYNSNPYTIFWYFRNVQLIDIHKVNQIAAGNGLLSDKKGSKYKGILQY
jgi:hypothetical protein